MWLNICRRNVKYDRFVAIRCVFSNSKYSKTRFRPGLCPGPRWGSLRCSPRHPSQLGRGPSASRSRRLQCLGCQAPQHKFLALPMVWVFISPANIKYLNISFNCNCPIVVSSPVLKQIRLWDYLWIVLCLILIVYFGVILALVLHIHLH